MLGLGQLANWGKSSEHPYIRPLKLIFAWLIKLGAAALAIWYILHRLVAEEVHLESLWLQVTNHNLFELTAITAVSLLLVALNWGLEMFKWNLLIAPQLGTRWQTAVKGVLSGTTFGVFTPNRFGEFIGRVLALGPKQRITGTLLSFVNGVAQTVATFTFGVLGMIFLLETAGHQALGDIGTYVLELTLLILWLLVMAVYGRLNRLTLPGRVLKWWPSGAQYMSAVRAVDSSKLHRLYGLSLLRFTTFIAQYWCVFYYLIDSPDFVTISALAMLTMFSATMLSFVPIPEVLLKEAVAISYFSLFHFDLIDVGQAVLLVWILNVALPAVVGAMVLWTYRIFRNT